jgi:hypothetical protein
VPGHREPKQLSSTVTQHEKRNQAFDDSADMPLDKLDAKGVKCIIEACDDAWHSLQGSIFTAVPRATQTREFLVQNIIESALRGELDANRLRNNALRDFELGCSARTRTDTDDRTGKRKNS